MYPLPKDTDHINAEQTLNHSYREVFKDYEKEKKLSSGKQQADHPSDQAVVSAISAAGRAGIRHRLCVAVYSRHLSFFL